MKTTTLLELSQTLVNAGYADIFDGINDIIDIENMTASVNDPWGDRYFEFKIIKLDNDMCKILVEFDDNNPDIDARWGDAVKLHDIDEYLEAHALIKSIFGSKSKVHEGLRTFMMESIRSFR